MLTTKEKQRNWTTVAAKTSAPQRYYQETEKVAYREEKKIPAIYIRDKRLISKVYKELL